MSCMAATSPPVFGAGSLYIFIAFSVEEITFE